MKSFKTDAIVIKRIELGEADRLLTVFTRERGKLKALVKGARKPLSRLAGHLEPATLTYCQLQESKTFFIVTGAEIKEAYGTIHTDLAKTGLVYYLLEMVDLLTHENDQHEEVFTLLAQSLDWLDQESYEDEQRKRRYQLLAAAFVLKLLSTLGYRLELDGCINCHQPLKPTSNFFSLNNGGLLGPSCRIADPQSLAVSPSVIKALRLLLTGPIVVIDRLAEAKRVREELVRIIESYLHYYTGRELYSAHFLQLV